MSKHWNPDEELALAHRGESKPRWPEGATAGLVAVGLACFGVAMLLYRLAGPRDVFTS